MLAPLSAEASQHGLAACFLSIRVLHLVHLSVLANSRGPNADLSHAVASSLQSTMSYCAIHTKRTVPDL